MSNKLLTFEMIGDEELEIHGDAEGLRFLVKALTRVVESGEHDHLMTPSWGGTELSEDRQNERSHLVNKVTIRVW